MALHIQELYKFLSQYDIKIQNIEEIGPNRYRIDGPFAVFEARIVPLTSALLRSYVNDAIARRGFRRTQRFILNVYHEKVIPVDEAHVLYVTDAMVGKPFEVNLNDIGLAARTLVTLHGVLDGVGREIQESMPGLMKLQYAAWYGKLQKGRKAIRAEQMMVKDRSATEKTWAKWLAKWEKQASTSLRCMEEVQLPELAAKSEEQCELAWNGVRLKNFVHIDSTQIGLVQVLDPVFDIQLCDVATLGLELCTQGHAEESIHFIESYHAERALSRQELMFIRAYAAYPHLPLHIIKELRKNKGDLETVIESWNEQAEAQQKAADEVMLRANR